MFPWTNPSLRIIPPFARIVDVTESIVPEEKACRSGSFTTSAQPARIAARTAIAVSSAPGSAITPTNISTTTPPNPPGNACPPWRADIPIGALAPLFVSRLPRRPALSYPTLVIPNRRGGGICFFFSPISSFCFLVSSFAFPPPPSRLVPLGTPISLSARWPLSL